MIKALFLEANEANDGEYKIYTDAQNQVRQCDLLSMLMIFAMLQNSPPLLQYIQLNLLPLLML